MEPTSSEHTRELRSTDKVEPTRSQRSHELRNTAKTIRAALIAAAIEGNARQMHIAADALASAEIELLKLRIQKLESRKRLSS